MKLFARNSGIKQRGFQKEYEGCAPFEGYFENCFRNYLKKVMLQ